LVEKDALDYAPRDLREARALDQSGVTRPAHFQERFDALAADGARHEANRIFARQRTEQRLRKVVSRPQRAVLALVEWRQSGIPLVRLSALLGTVVEAEHPNACVLYLVGCICLGVTGHIGLAQQQKDVKPPHGAPRGARGLRPALRFSSRAISYR
jgi:hypothetical protein